MYNVVTIGSALVDIFIHSAEFHLANSEQGVLLCEKLGDKIDVESFAVHSGGGASNTAVGFSRLGFKTAIIAEIGHDNFADTVIKELAADEVTTSLLIKERQEQTGGSVLLINKDGGRTALVYRGASSQLGVGDLPESLFASTQWIHLGSVGGQQAVIEKIFNYAHRQHVGLSWNPGKAELKLIAEGKLAAENIHCQILLLNHEEWQMVTAKHDVLQQRIEQIVITNGARGGQVLTAGKDVRPFTVKPVKSVDDTGAGDAFAVGYVGGHLLGLSPTVCLEWASANAASVVTQVGAKPGLLKRAQLEKLTKK